MDHEPADSGHPARVPALRSAQARAEGLRTRPRTILLIWLGFILVQGSIGLVLADTPRQNVLPRVAWNTIPQAAFGSLVLWRALGAGRRPLTWAGVGVELLSAVVFTALVDWSTGALRQLFIGWLSLTLRPPPTDILWRYQYWSGLLLTYAILTTAGRWIGAQKALREEESRAAEAEILRAEAELAALRARLNPHFLFNTLHTLLALVRRDPAAAERGLEQFGQMMQYALRAGGDEGDCVSLADELLFTRAYLALEGLRLGDRLRVHEAIEASSLAARIPALTLQPLVENAVRHGIGPRPSGGTVTITSRERAGAVVLEVADDGVGPGEGQAQPSEGHGIDLVRRRLRAAFGDSAWVDLVPAPAAGYRVRLTLPERAP